MTDVRVSGDTQQATIFYTVLGEAGDLEGTAVALASAKGLIRSEVGKQLGMRHVPTLEFVQDALPETARHIDDLLERVRESDAAVAQSRLEGAYAGDADPYKKRPTTRATSSTTRRRRRPRRRVSERSAPASSSSTRRRG